MALKYLKKNAASMTAGDFELADGSSAGAFANGDTLQISAGRQAVDTGVDNSTLSVESLDIREGWWGNLGSDSNHVKILAINTAEAATTRKSRIRYWPSAGTFWIDVVNTTLGCHFLQVGGRGSCFLCGGAVKNMDLGGEGYLKVIDGALAAASGVWQFMSGQSLIDTSATGNLLATANFYGGDHETRRGAATINHYGGHTIADIKNDAFTTLNLYGGSLEIRAHHATGPALTAIKGELDFRNLSRPIAFNNPTLGEIDILGYNPSLVSFTGTVTYIGKGPRGIGP